MIFTHAELVPILAPLALAPLVIHLLNKRFPQWRMFSSIDLIRKSMAQRSQLMRWRHWLLTLVRTLMVAACVAAFLGPVLAPKGEPPPTGGKRQVLIVIDHSYSMEAPEAGLTRRARAQVEAARVLDSLGGADEVNVLAVGRDTATASGRWSMNHDAARDFIKALGAGHERADFHKAMEVVASQLHEVKGAPEIYVISDFQRSNWADASFTALPKAARLVFVNVCDPSRAPVANRAITEVEVTSPAVLAGAEITLEVTVANHAAEMLDDMVEIVADRRSGFETPIKVQPWSVQQIPLRMIAPGPGWHTLHVNLKTADAMPQDNVFHVALLVSEQEEVVLASDDDVVSSLTLRFLQAAINPFADKRGSLLPRRVPASKLAGPDLAATSKVVLSRVAKLGEQQVRTLADFMKGGGGVLYFLDGAHDAENLTSLAEWFTQADAVPLRLGTRLLSEAAGGEPGQIAKGNFASRYLRLFRATSRGALAQLQFYERWQARPQEHANVLLSYADGTPALAHGTPGIGNLLLCNFSVAEVASNIARQRIFPAWIQELVAQLSGERTATPRHESGDVMEADVWTRGALDFVSPSGHPVSATRSGSGERVTMMVPATEPGFYTLLDAKKSLAHLLAANVPAVETDLRVLDASVTRDHATSDSVAGAAAVGAGVNYAELLHGRPVCHWFLIGALGALLLESLIQVKVRRAAS
ncbi:hypothetical protein AYO49_02140 [Verrucomicrobiaceae bacterium SCGC AG-212-N21]|nr:hypothetical protein AYO49_02140 [Verrucomicrobiaceae bacterium SCGC AG-212-N21]